MALARCAISRALFAMALSVLADSLALGAQSTRRTCCSVVWVHPARYRVFVAVIRSRARRMPETLMRLRRKWSRSWRPASSSPTTPTGRTRAPRSARLKTALAAPPGYDSVRRWRRIRTGASRETREISPETNSSRTKSPTTPMIWRGKLATISRRRARSTLASDLRRAPEDDWAALECLRCLRALVKQAPGWLCVFVCAPARNVSQRRLVRQLDARLRFYNYIGSFRCARSRREAAVESTVRQKSSALSICMEMEQ